MKQQRQATLIFMRQHDGIHASHGKQKVINGYWNKDGDDYDLNNYQIHFLVIISMLPEEEKQQHRINRYK